MARTYAQILTRIWTDRDFRRLGPHEQLLYLHLVSHPKLSYAGVTDWRPNRIAVLSDGLTVDDVETAAGVLVARGYLIIDEETEEVFVRSYHRNDGCLKVANMGKAVALAYSEVTSDKILGAIAWELQRLHRQNPEWKGWASIGDLLDVEGIDPATLVPGAPDDEPLPAPVTDGEPPF